MGEPDHSHLIYKALRWPRWHKRTCPLYYISMSDCAYNEMDCNCGAEPRIEDEDVFAAPPKGDQR